MSGDIQYQISRRGIVEERSGEREPHVKLTDVSWAGPVPCCPGQRPAKNQGVVRTNVLGEGRAQLGDGAGRCRVLNQQRHQARA